MGDVVGGGDRREIQQRGLKGEVRGKRTGLLGRAALRGGVDTNASSCKCSGGKDEEGFKLGEVGTLDAHPTPHSALAVGQ